MPKAAVGVLVLALGVILPTALAFAGSYTGNPSTDATQAQSDALSFIGTMVSAIAPILIAVAGGVIGITLLAWAIRTVFRKVKRAAHF